MGLFNNNRQNQQRRQQQQQHRDNVAPWEKYAREDDREQGWYCNHEHDDYGCDE